MEFLDTDSNVRNYFSLSFLKILIRRDVYTPFTAYPRQCIQLFLIRISYVEILIFQDFDKNFVARREQG